VAINANTQCETHWVLHDEFSKDSMRILFFSNRVTKCSESVPTHDQLSFSRHLFCEARYKVAAVHLRMYRIRMVSKRK